MTWPGARATGARVLRVLPVLLSVLLLVSVFVVAGRSVVESGPITIMADGSITPSTAPLERVGDYYTLTADITTDTDGIIVNASNIVLDGNGHVIQGNYTGSGIALFSTLNVTIKDFKITGFGSSVAHAYRSLAGISLDQASRTTIFGSSVSSIICEGYPDGVVGITAYENDIGPVTLDYAGSNVIHHNNISGGVGFFFGSDNVVYENNISTNGGSGIVVGGAQCVFYNNTIRDSRVGVAVGFYSPAYFYNNNFINNTVQAESRTEDYVPPAWNDNYPIGGNYWDDYNGTDLFSGPYQNITGSDGIGDTPYWLVDLRSAAEPEYDKYPLMHPIGKVDIHSVRVWIHPDGSMSPPDAPIRRNGDVYTLTGNILSGNNNGIVVDRENIVIDGSDFTVEGTGAEYYSGIYLYGISNVTIQNINIRNFYFGINLDSLVFASYSKRARYSRLDGNDLYGNHNGIRLNSSSYNSISGNTIRGCNDYGIWLSSSSDYNSISGNTVSDNYLGILLRYSSNNNISRNDIRYNSDGIRLESSSDYNSIDGNTIADNTDGLHISSSSNNSISGNTITNRDTGLILSSSSNNIVCHNNFNNTVQVDNGTPQNTNFLDNGSEGNYWSDYNGTDANHDGIGDTPYIIDTNNIDRYPLVVQYVIPELPSFPILLIFMIATLLAVIVYRNKRKS